MSEITGAEVAKQLTTKIFQQVQSLNEKEVHPCAAIIRLGEKKSDISYEKGATKKLNTLGIDVHHIVLPENISQQSFMEVLTGVNGDSGTHGILLLRPLPPHLDEKRILESINPLKDVDAISPYNIYKVMVGDPSGFAPCTSEAVTQIFDYLNLDLTGKHICVVGQSMVVGRPLSLLLLNRNATVTMCHIHTKNLAMETAKADIVIAVAGKRNLITAAHVKEGAIVIDVGINTNEHGHLCGDVSYTEVAPKATYITPVPGGVGAVTTTILADHIVKAAKVLHGLH